MVAAHMERAQDHPRLAQLRKYGKLLNYNILLNYNARVVVRMEESHCQLKLIFPNPITKTRLSKPDYPNPGY